VDTAVLVLVKLAMVDNPKFAVKLFMLSAIVLEVLAFPVWRHIAVSGCPSMSHLFVNIFSELAIIENVFFAARIRVNG